MLPRRDIQIKEEVLKALRWDTRIEVEVRKGTVTLSGTVDSYAVRLLAQEAAQFVDGVITVNNRVKVESPAHSWSDIEISVAARKALEWDSLIPHERIQTTVTNGWVALEGEVAHLRERDDAERIIRRLAGVRGVYNELTVNSPEISTEYVREAIEEELTQRARLEADRIKVSLQDGTLTLSGPVQSWEEEKAIISAASRAPGVMSIKDHLQVKS
jgi:osmotically-inducible protein OsmY